MSEGTKVFETLNNVNVNGHIEQKNKLTYLSWAWAWAEVMKVYPEAVYEIWKDEQNRPYLYDENLGYMVFTSVTLRGQTREMWLPVMDGANQAMKTTPYTYKVKKYSGGRWTGEYEDRTVQAATMMDINKTIMRCLVKNLAMFGLGLYIYAGEDLPEEEKIELDKKEAEKSLKMMRKTIVSECERLNAPLESWLQHYGAATVDDLNAEQAVKILNTLKERYPNETR